jgi:hypothetical protein
MTLVMRAIISLLAGIGSGLLGFWFVWSGLKLLGYEPGIGWDEVILAAIFLPFIGVTLLVFQTVSRAVRPVEPTT